MLILGVDVETTGLSDERDEITEIGAVLWDWDMQMPLEQQSDIIDCGKHISREITEITGLTNEICSKHGLTLEGSINTLDGMMEAADYVMAHNAPFDKGFIQAAFNKEDMVMPSTPWLDTRTDVKWRTKGSRKLGYLAADHGFINPFAHRALYDVLTMLKLASLYSLEDIIKRSQSPTVTLKALVSFNQKDLAKEKGFHWEAGSKSWLLEIKEMDLEDVEFSFRTVRI